MAIVTYQDLPTIRARHKNEKVVFASGVFDLTHAGHVLFFEDCKKMGDVLVIAVGNDEMIKKNKGSSRPIMNETMRLKMISSLQPVDYCLLEKSIPSHPLAHVELALQELKPNVYVVNEDGFDIPYRKTLVAQYGVTLAILPRTCPKEFENISTTKIIKKIKELL